MKKILSMTLACFLLLPVLGACNQEAPHAQPTDTTQPKEQEPLTELMEDVMYYENPVLSAKTEHAWEGYGFGDPFVMRHNGRYYLYVSTKDGQVGIQCWTSDNLVNWTYVGLCAVDERTRGAYAPEVYYYNGYFYMYTSPAGQGHYVLRSASPTGEFEVITDNMGMSIDGSVFIDRDGKWYFYTANHGQMMVYDMTSPSHMRRGRELASISVDGGWTEGPMTVYHDGYYYMTYTGNHVLSRAYRINYGVSATSPLKFDRLAVQNPLLVHTAGDLFGIGHSSTVKGPDLDSYYIVYHSLVNATPNRSTHVDRIVFNGTDMQIMGPVDGKQQVPDHPDVYHYFGAGESLAGWKISGDFGTKGTGLPLADGAMIVSEQSFTGDFTAEYNVMYIEQGAQAGALFAYADAQNFGACYFDPAEQSLCIEITQNGKTEREQIPLVKSFGEDVRFDCLQALQIERSGNTYTFYVNDRPAYTKQSESLSGGGIGYVTRGGDASFGFIGATGAVGGRGAADDWHSIGNESGLIPASHYTTGGFVTEQIEGIFAVCAPTGSVLNYRVLAKDSGTYDLSVRYAAKHGDAELEIFVDGESAGRLALSQSGALHTAIIREIPVKQGQHTLSFKVHGSDVLLAEMQVLTHGQVRAQTRSFDSLEDDCAYTDGNWRATGSLSTSRTPICAKRLYGVPTWGDYAVEVSVMPKDGVNCGLLVRATNPGAPNFVHQPCTTEDSKVGTDWVQGYYVGITADGVVLGKQNYGYVQLARADGTYTEGTAYALRAECKGATICVYVDGVLCLEYTDPDPFTRGMVGVRTYLCAASFDELQIEPIQ